jgi:hypothetical protein
VVVRQVVVEPGVSAWIWKIFSQTKKLAEIL